MLELTPPTKTPWQVQILTLDYLVEGHLDSDRDGYPFRLFNHDITPIPLSQARFRPTGDLKLPERPVTPWVLINGDDLVAIIPRDDASVAHAIQVNASDRIASRADVFVGPYVIRGTVHSPHEDLRIFAMRVASSSATPRSRVCGPMPNWSASKRRSSLCSAVISSLWRQSIKRNNDR